MISSQKDRVIIIGGKESDDSDSKVVEEIDFIKRNIVSLAEMKQARSNPNAFLVNDGIYVFGGSKDDRTHSLIGEKYALSGNNWKEVKPRNINENPAIAEAEFNVGPASLLYE